MTTYLSCSKQSTLPQLHMLDENKQMTDRNALIGSFEFTKDLVRYILTSVCIHEQYFSSAQAPPPYLKIWVNLPCFVPVPFSLIIIRGYQCGGSIELPEYVVYFNETQTE